MILRLRSIVFVNVAAVGFPPTSTWPCWQDLDCVHIRVPTEAPREDSIVGYVGCGSRLLAPRSVTCWADLAALAKGACILKKACGASGLPVPVTFRATAFSSACWTCSHDVATPIVDSGVPIRNRPAHQTLNIRVGDVYRVIGRGAAPVIDPEPKSGTPTSDTP
jgi:hypothetical protein